MFTPPQLFILIGLALFVAEAIIGVSAGFDLILIGSLLVAGGGVGLATNNPALMIGVSTTLAIAYIAFGRAKIRKQLLKVTHHSNIDKVIGQTGTVVRTITPDTAGLVRVDNEDWRATAEFDSASSDKVLYEKDKITVVSLDGVTLKVEKTGK